MNKVDSLGVSTKAFTINTKDINYKNLKGNKYKKTDDTAAKLWTDVEEESFIEWMKPPVSSDFKKLHGIIADTLEVGTYRFSVLTKGTRLLTEMRCWARTG